MPRYVIHVGPPKTGTTYLQQRLTDARSALLAQGVYYPTEWISPANHTMHQPLFDVLQAGGRKALEQGFKTLNARSDRTIVFSCEAFPYLSETGLILLRDLIGRDDTKMVFYARRWSDRFFSMWSQQLKKGQFMCFPDYCASFFRKNGWHMEVDYSVLWERHATVFGRENIQIISYSNLMDRKLNIFDHFCQEVLGVAEALPEQKVRDAANTALSVKDAEILRVLNHMEHARTGVIGPEPRKAFRRMRRQQADLGVLYAMMEPEEAALVIDDQAVQFDPAFANMEQFADLLVGDDPGAAIFQRRSSRSRYIRSGYLLNPEAGPELRRLHAQLGLGAEAT